MPQPTESSRSPRRTLGTMVTCGFPRISLLSDLEVAARLGASCVEILPHWRERPSPDDAGRMIADRGLGLHSVHGGWGGQSIAADRIDLSSLDDRTHLDSIDDLKRCLDWARAAGATHLIVHPGGLSAPEDRLARSARLLDGLSRLADHASGGPLLCVENMPPGVHPGSRMEDLSQIVGDLARDEVALVIDTGHAAIVAQPADQTLAAGSRLASTHVHDNDGRQDSHQIPGDGIIDWSSWVASLDRIDYAGPVMLECIRQVRLLDPTAQVDLGLRLRTLLQTD